MFVIHCKVSGGYTGYRESFLRGTNGKVRRFKTRGQAERKAEKCDKAISSDAMATFKYTVREI